MITLSDGLFTFAACSAIIAVICSWRAGDQPYGGQRSFYYLLTAITLSILGLLALSCAIIALG